MSVNVVVGLQRGDEGKGRFVDMLAGEHDIVARFNGGNNAGHTVVLPNNQVLKLHLVPSGIAHTHAINIIGNGTLLNPVKLVAEIADVESKGIKVSPENLKISSGSHLILPHHISEDELREQGEGRQGSTKSGIAQVSSHKAMRVGARAEMFENDEDLAELEQLIRQGLELQVVARQEAGLPPIDIDAVTTEYIASARTLAPFVSDTVYFLNQQLSKNTPARVLAEGAQAFLLDIDHGMYPFTSSSSTTCGGVSTGLGIPPMYITNVVGVAKAVQSHVGGGPFVTEVTDPEELAALHGDMKTVDAEFGTTTGRKRRLGYLDLPQIKRSQMVNGTHEMALTKLDWVPRYGKTVKICVAYERAGKTLEVSPDSASKLAQATPIYESLPTWDENIQDIRSFAELPENAQKYIEFIEAHTGVPITMIGVGPNREQVIVRA